MEYYHNPRCRKSREGLAVLEENGVSPKIRLYLEDLPSKEELTAILRKLKISPLELMRKAEPDYKAHVKGKELTDQALVALMVKYPKLIERPILIKGRKAAIGRPAENLLEIL